MMDITKLSQQFLNFAEKECKGSSPLYEYLSMNIAKDQEMLELCLHARNGQPIPNLLFGAIQYLLFTAIDHPLKEYYPSLSENPKQCLQSFDCFKSFCQEHEAVIQSLLQTKLVQTNEVRRCAYLYPIFSYIFGKVKKPLALI